MYRLDPLISSFLTERKSRNLSPKTITFYTLELRYFCEFTKNPTLENITPDIIRGYLIALSEHRNGGGCHAAFRAIKALMIWIWSEYEPNYKNPIRKIRPPQHKTNPLPGIPLGDVQKMINACTTQRDKTIIMFLTDSAARANEVCALSVGDLSSSGSILIRHGKGNKRRVVFIGKKTLRELNKYLKSRGEITPTSPLFTTQTNTRLTFSGLRQIIRRRALDAGIPTPGLHDFRRAGARAMLANKMDLISLSRVLGHSSTSITQLYVYQTTDDLQLIHSKTSPVDCL